MIAVVLSVAGKVGAWVIGTKAGRIVLLVLAIAIGLWIYGEKREADGREQARAEVRQNDTRAVERADEAERTIRRDPDDTSRSLSDGTF